VPDDDQQGHNGDERVMPGYPPPASGPPPPPPGPAMPPPPSGAQPSAYPPGYPPAPSTEPAYQAPGAWAAAPSPAVFGSPPPPPAFGDPGLTNGAYHDDGPSRRPKRRLMTALIVLIVLALVAAGAGVAVFSGSSPSTTTPSSTSNTAISPAARQLLQSSLAAAARVNSFHYIATSTLTGPQKSSQRTVGDAGPDSGRQIITEGTQKFEVLVVGTACFFKGNAVALTDNLGLSSSQAATEAGQWISLATTDAPYATVYAAVTAPSALADNITVVPQTLAATTALDGRRVQTVTGAIAKVKIAGATVAPKGTASLAVRATAPHLPVRYRERSTQVSSGSSHRLGVSISTVTFSRWGESVSITAPTAAVAYATLGVGSGPAPTTPNGTILT